MQTTYLNGVCGKSGVSGDISPSRRITRQDLFGDNGIFIVKAIGFLLCNGVKACGRQDVLSGSYNLLKL